MIGLWLFWVLSVHAHPDGHARIAALEVDTVAGACPAEALLQRARLHLQVGELTDALQDVRAARACEPALGRLELVQGHIHRAMGDHARAIDHLQRHLADQPDDAFARLMLARSLADTLQWAGADQSFADAIHADTRPVPDHYLWWSEVRVQLGDLVGALAVVELGLDRLHHSPALEDRATELELELGRPDAALARTEARLTRMPSLLALWATRATILDQTGPTEAALAAHRDVIAAWEALPVRAQNARNATIREASTAALAQAASESRSR